MSCNNALSPNCSILYSGGQTIVSTLSLVADDSTSRECEEIGVGQASASTEVETRGEEAPRGKGKEITSVLPREEMAAGRFNSHPQACERKPSLVEGRAAWCLVEGQGRKCVSSRQG